MTDDIRDEFRHFLLGALENHLYDECKYFAYEFLLDKNEQEREELFDDAIQDLVHLHMQFK